MFGSVATSAHSVNHYVEFAGPQAVEELRAAAAPLAGLRVLSLSSPAASVAVRSLLQSATPLLADLGVDVHWQQVRIPAEHLEMDRALRRALSGYASSWSEHDENDWRQFNQANAQMFDEEFDVVVVHHTASVGLHAALTQMLGAPPPGVWLWNSHRDYRAANPQAWSLIRQHADNFAGSVYDYKSFVRPDAPTRRSWVVSPGVDPLSPRSRPVADVVRETILAQRGLDTERPVLAQIVLSLREDDPLRVLDAYELLRRTHPELQLVIVNLQTEGAASVEQVNAQRERARALGDVLILTEMDRVGNVELSALREEATVLIHEGYPRGISMGLMEEMWQARPIVSASSSPAEALLADGKTALIANTPEEQAAAVDRLLSSPRTAARIGRAARQHVARGRLVTHHLAGWLRVLRQALGRRTAAGR